MVRHIFSEPGRTFSEFSLLTGLTTKECRIPRVSLATTLAEDLTLKIPFLSAAMTSVTGYDMAVELGKNGGMGVIPASFSAEEQSNIIKKVKSYETNFVDEPLTVRENKTIHDALKLVEQHGYSKLPVVDKNNHFLGIFDRQYYWESERSPDDNILDATVKFDKNGDIVYCNDAKISSDEAKNLMRSKNAKYMIILDEQDRLSKIAFEKDFDLIKVAAAITTHSGWKERVELNIDAGVDMIIIDTSDGFNEFAKELLAEYKRLYNVPICAGNIITYEGASYLMEAGADLIKVGMSSGSICSTQREKSTGRAPMTALLEADRARRDFKKRSGRYIPLIMDGGIRNSADMIIALSAADALMMGGYFNGFLESAGDKINNLGNLTSDAEEIVKVITFGEGSHRAQNLRRYGHSTKKTFFAEGVEGTVPFKGRLKPNIEQDLIKIKAALSNAGCLDLREFRKNAVLELNSSDTEKIVSKTHGVFEKTN